MHFGRESRENKKKRSKQAGGTASSSRPTTESLYSPAGCGQFIHSPEKEEGGERGDCKKISAQAATWRKTT